MTFHNRYVIADWIEGWPLKSTPRAILRLRSTAPSLNRLIIPCLLIICSVNFIVAILKVCYTNSPYPKKKKKLNDAFLIICYNAHMEHGCFNAAC
uniref:Uncharacterized protein n=1 Tax=Anguilla anguilla TaxID=7936 RepID=A0A0E9X8Y4_ANGAN